MSTRSTQSQREALLRRASSYLRSLAQRRNSRVVTADDVHNFLNRNGMSRSKAETRLSVIKSVLREPMFENTGNRVASNRAEAKGRAISAWTVS